MIWIYTLDQAFWGRSVQNLGKYGMTVHVTQAQTSEERLHTVNHV
jgi:hypothetical protein